MRPCNIISLGEVLWDLFPDQERFGGAPANFACHSAIHGGNVTMVSAVGDDVRGRQAIEILRSYRVDVSLIQIMAEGSTGTVGVQIDRAGKPTFTIHENSAWDHLVWTDELERRVQSADAVCFGTLGQRSAVSRSTIRRCVETARDLGNIRVLDINLRFPFYDDVMIRESVQLASILKLSDEELPVVCRACGVPGPGTSDAQIRDLLNRSGLEMIVMTRGADGAVLVTAQETVEQPGIRVQVQDTVGAGDAFTAGFLLGKLRSESLSECLLQACRIASRACEHAGAVPPSVRGADTNHDGC
jgi:fructokinase